MRFSRLLFSTAVCVVLGLMAGCAAIPTTTTQTASNPVTLTPATAICGIASNASSDAAIQVYFTDPQTSGISKRSAVLEDEVLSDLCQARQSIKVAMYSFTLENMADGLIAAQRRGVNVQMVMESDNMNTIAVQKLVKAGIPVVGDTSDGLMHDKFIIVDDQVVWTGSFNATDNSLETDNNNFVRIESNPIAQDYATEFDEMYVSREFGQDSPNETDGTAFTLNNMPVKVYFAPEDRVAKHLIDLVGGAQHSIQFLAYSFTSDSLADTLLARMNDGVVVQGVFDEGESTSAGAEYDHLRRAGLDVRLDGNPGLMHEKVIILDGETIVFGSYNFTKAADQSNDENLVVIEDSSLAQQFQTEFERVYQQAQPQS
jgi:phosphatidylserine/phosphatidylglycerophosphate/cardiolipin synthase-like enzyme